MIYKQPCTTYEKLAKETLLAMLDSKLDRSKTIVVNTGKIIDLSPIAAAAYNQVLQEKVDSNAWTYADSYFRPSFKLTNQGEVVDINKTKMIVNNVSINTVKLIKNTSTAKYLMNNNIYKYINNKTWIYYEEIMPRRMLLTSPDWKIVAFDPASKNVCVTLYTNASAKKPGERQFNFTLKPIS
jgi:hypothetical protein